MPEAVTGVQHPTRRTRADGRWIASAPCASCLDSIEPGERSGRDDGSLRLTLLRPGRDGEPDREVSVGYHATDPAQGLQAHDRVK